MKILEIILKEISLVKSQKIALLLIVIYPLLVIGLIGSAFTDLDTSRFGSLKVGLVNDITFDYNLTDKLYSLDNVQIVKYADVNTFKSALAKKEVVAGLHARGGKQNEQISVDLYYDNSSLLSSRFFMEMAKAMVQRITVESSQNDLNKIWGTISYLASNVEREIFTLDEFRTRLDSAQVSLNALEEDLKEIDFNSIEDSISSQGRNIESLKASSVSFKAEVASFKRSFEDMKRELSDLNTTLYPYRNDLNLMATQIEDVNLILNATAASLMAMRESTSDEAQKLIIDQQINSINLVNSKVYSWKPLVVRMLIISENLSNSQSSLNQTILRADSLFSRVDSESNALNAMLDSSIEELARVNSQLAVFKRSINEVKLLITESRSSANEIKLKIDESKELLNELSEKLAGFGDINPRVLAQPVVFFEKKLFAVDTFGILVSNSSSIVLILTCMLLTSVLMILEKNQNIFVRFSMSPTRKYTFVIGKLVGQLVVALVEAAIIFAIAFMRIPLPFSLGTVNYIGFGLTSNVSPLDLLIAVPIIAISFISLGLLVSFFTKSQSTAILSSLLIIVPMLFLSGIIFPIEFMDPFMQTISSFLPLTISNNILVSLLVKGLPLYEIMTSIYILLGFSIVIIAAVILKKD